MKKRSIALILSLVLAIGLALPALAAEYTVVKGDTLSKIAQKELGDSAKWKEIYEANKEILKDPNKIYVGQKLTIPGDEAEPAPAGQSATATAAGYEEGEVVTVTVTVDSGKIVNVVATSTHESEFGQRAIKLTPKAMVEQNTVNVDTCTGATATSTAIIEAARQAYAQLTTGAEMTTADLENWALANGFVKAADYNIVTGVDALTGATEAKMGGVNYGAIEWSTELQETTIREFLKGGKYLGSADFAQDDTGYNYREMYQMATSFNNTPSNTNLELVLDAKNLKLVGVSEAGTGKTLQFLQNPDVSISWCKQLRLEDEENGYNYYCSYGVQFNGKVRVFTLADFETTEGQDAILNLYDCYYPTLASTWQGYAAAIAGKTGDELREAKLAYAKTSIARGSSFAYEIIPERIVITAPFLMNMIPQMANGSTFTTVQEGEQKYAYDLDLTEGFLDQLVAYKAAYVATEEGKAAVEAYYTTSPMSAMFKMLDPMCAQFGMPTSLEAALAPNNAAGLKTQTTWTPAQ